MTSAPVKKGDRIKLISMPEDPDPIPPGTTGTVEDVVDLCDFGPGRPQWQVHVKWDAKRSLSLIIPPDRVSVING